MLELLERLVNKFGASGNEDEIRDAIKEEIRGKVDIIKTDPMGNLIAVKKGTGRKIMLAAHMDEIGVIATYIDEKGFIRFSNIGWVSPYYALGQRVRFKNGTTGAVFYEEKLDDMKNLKLSKMYIDIGAQNKSEAETLVKPGDAAVFEGAFVKRDNTIVSKALDDRCGCAALIRLINDPPVTNNEIYYVFTTQEELGLRGAKTAAFNLKPDIAIAIDVTDTGDTPEGHPLELRLGKGPAVKIKDDSYIAHPSVRKLIEDAAIGMGIEYQREILESGGTDAGAIHLEAGGIPSGGVSVVCRYVHSPVETISINDLEKAVMIIKGSVETFKGL